MNNIKELKDKHKKELDMYSENIREHIEEYGAKPCDYLLHRQRMESYHRGAWNALNALDREI
ncbi:unnamed protein product [marine sediment metagenome]|uniref:Uncharacterized protein n=1 Tax=marine sediment metagenome TaxID=412755 RepID=X0W2H6_9ZZZZ